ncbi:MAG: protein kinase, partial [Rhizobacter sp.]|nr:protein kinase [Rhizobacter sp.]
DLVFARSSGNPLFAVQFIGMLADSGILVRNREVQAWEWDLLGAHHVALADDELDLMLDRLDSLPKDTRQALKTLACIGHQATLVTLTQALRLDETRAIGAMMPAVESGLLVSTGGGYRFAHDRIQEASYARIAPDDRALRHLEMGRRLLAAVPPERLADAVFDIANQWLRGASLVTTDADRETLGRLCLLAGERAMAQTAYDSGLGYFKAGDELMVAGACADCPALAIALSRNRAECEFLTGALLDAEQRLRLLVDQDLSLLDLAACTWLQITLYTALDRCDTAVDTCLAYLERAGVTWSRSPSREEVREEYDLLLAALGDRPIASLIDLPTLSDAERGATLHVLTAGLPPAFFTNENLVCRILCRMANMSLRLGNSDASALAYAYLGMVVGPQFGDYRAAYEFGKLGFDLVETRGLDRFKARVYMCFAYHVMPWTQHIRNGLGLLRQAFDTALEVGDITYAGFSSCTLISSLLADGQELDAVAREAHAKLDYVTKAKFGLVQVIVTSQLRLIASLQGRTRRLGSFDDALFDESRFEAMMAPNRSLDIAACWHWVRKLQANCHAGEWQAALGCARQAGPLLWTSFGHFELAEYHFYAALARAGCYSSSNREEQAVMWSELLEHQAQLATWAAHSPANFAHRAALVNAEMDSLCGRSVQAMHSYDDAIRLAQLNGFIHHEALALESAAHHHAQQGLRTIATSLLRDARHAYLRWGAHGKVAQLDAQHAGLLVEPAQAAGSRSDAYEDVDIATVVRSSEAVSGQASLERLIDTLMVIALENAGARRGLLLLPRGDELCIEAEATIASATMFNTSFNTTSTAEADGVKVAVRRAVPTANDLPHSMLAEVRRTHEAVILQDARRLHPFTSDPYLMTRDARSVLCLPLVKQTALIGVLYLENGLVPHAFTPARLAVLKLLASTAAMALENASLGEKEALLREIHHRVKNNLQLISSLLSLQASRIVDPSVAEMFAESRSRVRSMALVHENLYRAGNFSKVSMRDHLINLCAQIARAYGAQSQRVEILVTSDDVELGIDRAVSCGLIVNELVSNALKHGFPGDRSGMVRVGLRADDSLHCVLSVHDNGIGFQQATRPGQADTLGLQLVEDLAGQLNGVLTMTDASGGITPGGTRVAVTFNLFEYGAAA